MKRRHGHWETGRVWLYVLLMFLLALALLLATQAVFAAVNSSFFVVKGLGAWLKIVLGNLHFGLAGTAMCLWPFVVMYAVPVKVRCSKWFGTVGRTLFVILAMLMLVANLVDIPYYQWTLRRTTSEIFGYLGTSFTGGFGTLLLQFLHDFWPYFLLGFALLALLIWMSGLVRLVPEEQDLPAGAEKHCARTRAKGAKRCVRPLGEALQSVAMLLLAVLAIRGGIIFQHKPLSAIDASRYAAAGNAGLVVNTPFSIIRTLGHESGLKPVEYYSESELEQIFSPLSQGAGNLQWGKADGAKPNVVLIILESFSEEYMGCLNGGGESWTPFLDSLSAQCTLFQGMANGKRSIESLPSLLSGIPSLMDEAYITSSYAQNKVRSLPQILKQHGYATAFFHGAYNGSMNFDSYTRMAGIDRYYGMNEYRGEEGFDGVWGIFDEPFLQFAVGEMSTIDTPFFAAVYTISSHHPYAIPEQHKGRFRKGDLPILETVGYADYALGRFFASASRCPWFENTIFIITADHAAQPMSDRYASPAGQFRVPMMVYRPGLPGSRSSHIFQHCDLMPTVLDMLGLTDPCMAFGSSALRGGDGFHVAYTGNAYQLISRGYAVALNGDRTEAYRLESDPLMHSNLWPVDNDTVQSNLSLLKAIVQQYSARLIGNRMLPENK